MSAKLFDRVFFRKGQNLFLEVTVYSDLLGEEEVVRVTQ